MRRLASQSDRVIGRLREPVLSAGCKLAGDIVTNVPFGSTPNPVLPPQQDLLHIRAALPLEFANACGRTCSKMRKMSVATPSRLARLRALCAALGLLIAAVAAPIALASRTADMCGMACCVNEGRCCCNPRHATVKGQASDDKHHISESELSAPCTERCATPVRSSNLLLRDNHRATALQLVAGEPALICLEQVVLVRDNVDSGSSAPRAPPSSSTI